jgi:hypothetical protein
MVRKKFKKPFGKYRYRYSFSQDIFFKKLFLLRNRRLIFWDFIYFTQSWFLPPLRRLWGKPGSNPGLLRDSLVSASGLNHWATTSPKSTWFFEKLSPIKIRPFLGTYGKNSAPDFPGPAEFFFGPFCVLRPKFRPLGNTAKNIVVPKDEEVGRLGLGQRDPEQSSPEIPTEGHPQYFDPER